MTATRTTLRRGWRSLAALLALALVAGACRGADDDGYEVTATFARAPGLFEESRVKVMGLDVGTVTSLDIEGDRIRATLRIDDDVPLPRDVVASITPLTLIGERNVVLAPAYRPGDERLPPGAAVEHTNVAPEPDDVLEAATDLIAAIDTERTRTLLTEAAGLLDGRGEDVGRALERGAALAAVLRAHDDQLLDLADGLTELTATLNTREEQLTRLFALSAAAADTLTVVRGRLTPLLRGLVDLTAAADRVLRTVESTLPQDLATLAAIARRLEANVGSVQQLIEVLPVLAAVLLAAYRPDTEAVKLRLSGGPLLETVVEDLADLLGVPPPSCVPTPDVECEP